jgi:hypothetical protein
VRCLIGSGLPFLPGIPSNGMTKDGMSAAFFHHFILHKTIIFFWVGWLIKRPCGRKFTKLCHWASLIPFFPFLSSILLAFHLQFPLGP